MTKESCFAYDEDGYLTNQTCYFMPNASKYLLGILNSKIIYFYMKEISSTLGENSLRWIKQFIEKLPIPKTESKNQKLTDEILAIVDKILKLKDKKTDTKDLESKIDQLIYRLYDLTPEEIALIESL